MVEKTGVRSRSTESEYGVIFLDLRTFIIRPRLFHFRGHKLEKIESYDIRRAQMVYNHVYKYLNGERSKFLFCYFCSEAIAVIL